MIRCELTDEKRRREEQQRLFLDVLRGYHQRGVAILIDGRECLPQDFSRLFVRKGRSFYMGDYIGDETGTLREIHFDRVYYR